MLQCEYITHHISGKVILSNIGFKLESRQHLLITGPSGCGKTTLLFILAGLLNPNEGVVSYNDIALYNLGESDRDKFRGENLGIILQTFHLIKILTVRQNLLLLPSFQDKPVDDERIYSVLHRLRLADKSHCRADTLSVGEAQRLAIARAIICKPQWILCDEPTSSLDDYNTAAILDLLEEEANGCSASLIVVTHDKRVTTYFHKHNILSLGGVV